MKWWRMFQDSTRDHISPYLLVVVNTGLFSVITYLIGEYCFRPSRIVVLDLFGVTPLHECSNPGSTCNIKNWAPTSSANIASAPLESSSSIFLESPLFTN